MAHQSDEKAPDQGATCPDGPAPVCTAEACWRPDGLTPVLYYHPADWREGVYVHSLSHTTYSRLAHRRVPLLIYFADDEATVHAAWSLLPPRSAVVRHHVVVDPSAAGPAALSRWVLELVDDVAARTPFEDVLRRLPAGWRQAIRHVSEGSMGEWAYVQEHYPDRPATRYIACSSAPIVIRPWGEPGTGVTVTWTRPDGSMQIHHAETAEDAWRVAREWRYQDRAWSGEWR